jgi:hypothetical protein
MLVAGTFGTVEDAHPSGAHSLQKIRMSFERGDEI